MSMTQDPNQRRSPFLKDVFFQILALAIETASSAASSIQKMIQDLHLRELVDDALRYFQEHPFLSLFVAGLVVSCGIPIFAFFCFALITVIMTFIGFIFIEGTLLTVGSMMLCGFLLTIVFIVLLMSSILALSYFGCIQIASLMRNPSSFLHNILNEKVILSTINKQQTNVNNGRPSETLKAHNVD